MTHLDKTINKARRRITLDRWLRHATFALMAAAMSFALVTLVVRLYGWDAPLAALGVAFGAGALIAATVWSLATRVDSATAAAALDEAAGLRERLSSGFYCGGDDPFERAVRLDAEQTSARLSPRAHLRLHRPPQLATAVAAMIVAAAMFLVPPGVLARAGVEDPKDAVQVERTSALVKKQTSKIKKMARANAEFKKIADDLDKLAETRDGDLHKPADLRDRALKKLDELQDALKQRRGSDKMEHAKEFKKMLRGLKLPDRADNPTSRLAKSLASGDFKAAREQLRQMQKQLAEMAKTQDASKLQATQKQLDDLAKKLEALARSDKLREKLAQAGIKPEDIEKLMKNVSKEDIEKLKEQLQKQGMSQKAIEKMAKQCQKQSGANGMAQQLAQALAQAGAAAGAGNAGKASEGMGNAAGQLSEMEMLEQEMNQIDSMIAATQDARNGIGNPCPTCNGSGKNGGRPCGSCGGSGSQRGSGGMGANAGQGRGGIASEASTRASFTKRRQKVPTVRGAITGQYLVDGEQYKGDISPAVVELLTAAESRATDAIERRRIPRRYHKFIKAYFSDLREDLDQPPPASGDDQGDSPEEPSEPIDEE